MILLFTLIATLLIAVSLPILGQRVLERRIVFIDLALAQVAATGYAIGLALDQEGVYIAIATTAVTVLLMAAMDEDTKLPKEAVMGGVYAFATSIGMVVLSLLPFGQGQLMDLLYGSVLAIDMNGIIELAIFSALGLALALPKHKNTYGGRLRFFSGLSLIIVPAIHIIGILLVFAYLVMPALAVWRAGRNGPAWQALLLAIISSIAGTLLADLLDLPTSTTVVLTLGCISSVTATLLHFRSGKPKAEQTATTEADEKEDPEPSR